MIAAGKRRLVADALSFAVLGVAVTAVSLMAAGYLAPLRQASRWLDDLRDAYLAPLAPQSPDVAVLAIGEDTMQALEYRSPVDRAFLADLVRRVSANEQVRAIGVDMIFDQPTTEAADAALRQALLDSPVPVVVATGESATGLSAAQLGFQSRFLEGVGQGSAMLVLEGGVLRTHFPRAPATGTPTFVQSLADAAGIQPPSGPTTIRFRRAALDNASPIRIYPAHTATVLPPEWLAGRIVLIGVDLPDRDQHRTPLSVLGGEHEYTAGVLIHARALAQIAAGDNVPSMSGAGTTAMVLLAVFAGIALVLAPIPPAARIAVAVTAVAGWWLAGFTPAVYRSVPLPLVPPTLGFAVAAAAATAIARQRERRQRLFLHSAFNQYVSPQIIDDILEHPERLALGGELREMSFIFTDIAGFSSLAERLAPAEVVALLTDYLDGVVEIALRHRGTIARFVGDALVIFFGAPVTDADHRGNAVRCALAIDAFCEDYRRSEKHRDKALGETRIGVHAGQAVVGNIGGRRRFEYTAHGDAVNTAARLESANRHFGTRVCLSADVLGAGDVESYRPIGDVVLKGRSAPVGLYTSWHGVDGELRHAYGSAFEAMQRGAPDAVAAWETLAGRLPKDGLVAFHARRLRAGETGAVFRLDDK